MTEKNYSVNFKLFNRDGLNAQFTVRDDDAHEHINALTAYLNTLSAMGWSIQETERGLFTTDNVIGYMWVQFNNKKTNQIDVCCALYTERGLFKSYTVYPESFAKLPQEVLQTMPDDPGRAFPTAPDKEKAMGMKAFHHWKATINITPRLNHEGEPVKNDKGYIQYLYDGVAGTKTTAETTPEPQPTKPPVNLDKSKVAPELVSARNTFHALGSTLYGSDWNAKRAAACKARGLASSNDASLEVVLEMIARLEDKARDECATLAEEYDDADLQNLVNEFDQKAWSIGKISGVPLSKLLAELRLPRKLPEKEIQF